MSPLRVLVLTPWPSRVPKNGGSLRCAAILQAYKDAGHVVHTTGLYDASRIPKGEFWPWDIPITSGVETCMGQGKGNDTFLRFWECIALAPDSYGMYVEAVKKANPDILQFEEPFLWPIIRRLKADGLLKGTRVVHSSYNFETKAWNDLKISGAAVSQETLADIAQVEAEIALACDLIVTVSQQDADEFVNLGAKNVVVAINGIGELPAKRTDAGIVNAYLKPEHPYAIYVSSAHPPNSYNFLQMAVNSRRYLRNGEIVVCGQVNRLITASPLAKKAQHILEQVRYLGWVDQALLEGLYMNSHVVILPKTLGGGSNLKTAEALASGRPIVANRLAFTGFEAFSDLAGVDLIDEPDQFWERVDELLAGSYKAPLRDEHALKNLLWSEVLRPMVVSVESM